MKPSTNAALLILAIAGSCLLPSALSAQNAGNNQARIITLQQAIEEALNNNLSIKSANYNVELQRALRRGTNNTEKMNFSLTQGQINSIKWDNYINITQRIENPLVYKKQGQLAEARIQSSQQLVAVREVELIKDVKDVYSELVYLQAKRSLLIAQDTLYNNLARASNVRYRTGESTLLEKTTSETQSLEIKNRIVQNDAEMSIARQQLQTLMNISENILAADTQLVKREIEVLKNTAAIAQSPVLQYLQKQMEVSRRETEVQQAKRLPDFFGGYFNQSFRGVMNVDGVDKTFNATRRFQGVQVGIAIPILPSEHKAKIAASKINERIAATDYQYQQTALQSALKTLSYEYNKHRSSLDYYEKSGLPQADLILSNAERAFRSGEIPYMQYLQSLTMALKIKYDYIDELNLYNRTITSIENILGKK